MADGAAKRDGRNLMTIAETKNGNTELKDGRIDLGGVLGIHAGGATRQDEGSGAHISKLGCGDIARDDLGIDMEVTHTAGDELAVLRAKVKNVNYLVGGRHRFVLPTSTKTDTRAFEL